MITTSQENDAINVKLFILDPLSVIIKLAILSNKPVGTKLLFQNNVIYFQEPGPFQSICRTIYKTNQTDLKYMYNPTNIACLHFLSKSFLEKYPSIKNLFSCALNGIKKLIETYKSKGSYSIILTLNYYCAILSNHIDQAYNENMFIKDSFTCYYTQSVIESLNNQWTDKNIKIILDLISFLTENSDAANYVKSLETIMIGIDEKTKSIITEIF